jgi:hypothetical protein
MSALCSSGAEARGHGLVAACQGDQVVDARAVWVSQVATTFTAIAVIFYFQHLYFFQKDGVSRPEPLTLWQSFKQTFVVFPTQVRPTAGQRAAPTQRISVRGAFRFCYSLYQCCLFARTSAPLSHRVPALHAARPSSPPHAASLSRVVSCAHAVPRLHRPDMDRLVRGHQVRSPTQVTLMCLRGPAQQSWRMPPRLPREGSSYSAPLKRLDVSCDRGTVSCVCLCAESCKGLGVGGFKGCVCESVCVCGLAGR